MKIRPHHFSTLTFGITALFAPAAQASTVQMCATDLVNTTCIVDGGGGDNNPNVGGITFIGAIGDWFLNVSTGLADPPGSLAGSLPVLQLHSNNQYRFGSGGVGNGTALYLLFTDIGIDKASFPANAFEATIAGTNNGNTSQIYDFYDAGNIAFGRTTSFPSTVSGGGSGTATLTGCLPGPACTSAFGNGLYRDTELSLGPGSGSGLYSLTQMMVLTATSGNAFATFDSQIQQTSLPEPTSILLFGAGIIGLVARRGRNGVRRA